MTNAKATAQSLIINHGRFGALDRCEEQLAQSPNNEFWMAVKEHVCS